MAASKTLVGRGVGAGLVQEISKIAFWTNERGNVVPNDQISDFLGREMTIEECRKLVKEVGSLRYVCTQNKEGIKTIDGAIWTFPDVGHEKFSIGIGDFTNAEQSILEFLPRIIEGSSMFNKLMNPELKNRFTKYKDVNVRTLIRASYLVAIHKE